ncbi:MAG: sulfotransferase [Symploca sp. SIO3C6]|nr:sulfotransferase [Symploca sp. SIO3C6]
MTTDINLITQPIFLVGAERSGTTVLRLMLKHHPKVAWCCEFEYAVDCISNSGDLPQLDEYYTFLETNFVFQSTGFRIDRSLSYPQLLNSFLCQERELKGKSIVGATVHRDFDRLLGIWPSARFIHIIRDGRDVARSCIGMGWAGNVWTGVERWIEAEHLWDKLTQVIPAEQRIDITYEELISEPVKTLTCLCNFIGIAYDQAMISYHQTSTYDFPDPSFIGQWRRKLSDYEVQLIESQITDMLVDRGYELSGLPVLKTTPLIEQGLRLQDWWARLQFRLQRNGMLLFLSDYLSRRLGIKKWQKSVRLKLNAIKIAFLK